MGIINKSKTSTAKNKTKKSTFKITKQVPKKMEPKTYEKVFLYFVIVNDGHAEEVINLLQSLDSSIQFAESGIGTASKQILDVLGAEDNKKDIVCAFVREEILADIEKELTAYFIINKRNRGIGFAIGLNSLIGENVYHFLINKL